MLLSVKILGDSTSSALQTSDSFEVVPQDSVESLKERLRERFGLEGVAELKLLFQGKTLQDGTSLDSYKLSSGAKLHLMVRRDPVQAHASHVDNPTQGGAIPRTGQAAKRGAPQTTQATPPQPKRASSNLDEALFSALRKHFRSDEDTRKVIFAFKRDFHGKLSALNLDDIERVTGHYNQSNAIQF